MGTYRYRLFIKKCLEKKDEMNFSEIHEALRNHYKWEPTFNALNNILSKNKEFVKVDKWAIVKGTDGRKRKITVWKLNIPDKAGN